MSWPNNLPMHGQTRPDSATNRWACAMSEGADAMSCIGDSRTTLHAAGHRRAINPGVGSITVTNGASTAQLSSARHPDRSDSQADSADPIPVTALPRIPSPCGRSTRQYSSRSVRVMDMVRQVIVFDAADLHAESTFWAGILGGHVFKDTIGTASSTRLESGGSACNWHRTMFRPTGRMERPSKCISTCTSMTREPRMKRQSASAPGCYNQLLIWMSPRVTRCMRTRLDIRSASAGDTRPEKRSQRSSQIARAERPAPGAHRATSGATRAGLQFGLQYTAVPPSSS